METQTIFQVTTEGDCEGRSTMTLGYCTGNPTDIKAYFESQKTYEIRLSELKVKHITPTSAKERQALIAKKQELEEELALIKKRL